MEKEIWKQIKDFEFYEVSNYGRIRSKKRIIKRKNPRYKNAKFQKVIVGGKIINGWIQTPNKKYNYKRRLVVLRKNNKSYSKKVHHLVLETFVCARPNNLVCCHNDGNSLNNYYKNLRWGSMKENTEDSINQKTKTNPPIKYGENHHNVTISNDDVKLIINYKYYHGLYSFLAKKYNTSVTTISRIYNKKTRVKI